MRDCLLTGRWSWTSSTASLVTWTTVCAIWWASQTTSPRSSRAVSHSNMQLWSSLKSTLACLYILQLTRRRSSPTSLVVEQWQSHIGGLADDVLMSILMCDCCSGALHWLSNVLLTNVLLLLQPSAKSTRASEDRSSLSRSPSNLTRDPVSLQPITGG